MSKHISGLAAIVGAVGVIAIAPIQAEAATVTYSDRNLWQNAAGGGVITETFDNPTGNQDSIAFPSIDVVSLGLPATSGVRNEIFRKRFRAGINNTLGDNRYDSIVWTFGGPVNGFFADFFNVDDGTSLSGNYGPNVDGGTNNSLIDLFAALNGATNDNGRDGGFGLLSDTPFDTVTYAYTGEGDAFFSVDNLAVDVPTPALLPGIIGMGIAAMRKKKSAEAETEEA